MAMERPSIAAAAFDRPSVRVRTLANIRWIAIFGQFITLLVVGLWFEFPLPWGSLLAAVGASMILNIGLSTLYERTDRMTGRELSLHLAFDLIQAGVLLFLTGGLSNPFALLLIVPVTIAATLLRARDIGGAGLRGADGGVAVGAAAALGGPTAGISAGLPVWHADRLCARHRVSGGLSVDGFGRGA